MFDKNNPGIRVVIRPMEAIDISKFISENDNVEKSESKRLLSACHRAVLWLEKNLKSDADPNGKAAFFAATAMARFNFFCDGLRQAESFKAGDISVNRDTNAEYAREKALLDNALCEFADILKDGGFCFETT